MGGFGIINQDAMHFLTFTIEGWIDVFTRKDYKDILVESIKFCQQKKGLILFAYVIMSNHLHLIARTDNSVGLSSIIRDFKSFPSKSIIEYIIKSGNESRCFSHQNKIASKIMYEIIAAQTKTTSRSCDSYINRCSI